MCQELSWFRGYRNEHNRQETCSFEEDNYDSGPWQVLLGKGPLLVKVRFQNQKWPWSRGTVSSELSMLRMPHPWQDIGKEFLLFDFFMH